MTICFGLRYGDSECEKRLAVPCFTAPFFPSLDKKEPEVTKGKNRERRKKLG